MAAGKYEDGKKLPKPRNPRGGGQCQACKGSGNAPWQMGKIPKGGPCQYCGGKGHF